MQEFDGSAIVTFVLGSETARQRRTLVLKRIGGEWKIAHRRTVFDWNRDTPANEGWCLGYMDPSAPGMRRGRKDATDPTYEKF